MTPVLVFNPNSELLEGPVFDKNNDLLYFVSILDCLVYCFNPITKEISSVKLDSPVSCVYILGRKRVMVASKDGFFEIDFNNSRKDFLFQIGIGDSVRYNDGTEDSAGRIIIGTMGYPDVIEKIGNIYSYHEGKEKVIIRNTTISNGLVFTSDDKFLYFIDTPTKKVAKYLYDIDSGNVKFDSYVIEFKEDGSPDGMCIDKDGMLWIAEWGGGCISKWNPSTGNKIEEIKFPCVNVTSCCFDNFDNLYVTTAKDDPKQDIHGGGLYYINFNKTS